VVSLEAATAHHTQLRFKFQQATFERDLQDWESGETWESSLDSNSSTSPVNESQYFSDAIGCIPVPGLLLNLS
jgi:hypothetical protein